METEGRYIRFEKLPRKENRKTDVYKIVTKYENPEIIGSIEWFGRWRKYAFFPIKDTVYETVCLNDIIKFLNDLMLERKNENKK